MQTDLCRKLGIEFPIFAFTHCRDVVAAVSKAGGYVSKSGLPRFQIGWLRFQVPYESMIQIILAGHPRGGEKSRAEANFTFTFFTLI